MLIHLYSNENTMRCRIYYKDRYTNEIWYYETVWPTVSYEYLDEYMKLNKKIFLFITNISCEKRQKTKQVVEQISNSTLVNA